MHARTKFLLAALAAALILALAGCSGEDTGGGGAPESGSGQATTKVTGSGEGEAGSGRDEGSGERDERSGDREASGERGPGRNEAPEDDGDDRSERARPAEPSELEDSSGERPLGSYGSVHTVTEVTDGDTVEVSPDIAGRESVRLLLMDTPETYGGEEPLGPEATAYAERRLEGKRVALETDAEKIDPYDRALAYVWLPDGTLFNADITRQGLAQLAVFEPNVRYESRIRVAQGQAREAGRGIWGLPLSERCELADRDNPGIGENTLGCGGVGGSSEENGGSGAGEPDTPSGSTGGGVPPVSEDDCPQSAPIKGNDSDGELNYHPPDGQYYSVTNPEECFASAAAAEAAGYRASER